MTKYIVKRLLWMVPVIIGVSLLVFVLLDLSPGEPARMVLGDQATNEDVAEFNEKYGLDEPVLVQYGKYMWNVVTKGDFGESYVTGRSVTTEILNRFPKTFVLAVAITIIATMVGVLLGMLAGLHRGSIIDSIAQGLCSSRSFNTRVLAGVVADFAVWRTSEMVPGIWFLWAEISGTSGTDLWTYLLGVHHAYHPFCCSGLHQRGLHQNGQSKRTEGMGYHLEACI